VVNPKLNDAVDEALLKFAESTNSTTSMEISDAIETLREELRTGLFQGDPLPELTKRVQEVFDQASESRAEMIAASEASRAVHDAQVISGEESGVVVGWKWLCSDDCCDICLDIADNNQFIPLGGSFATIGGGDYADVEHPPAHPNCLLGETPILAADIRRTFVANYSGPIVRLITEHGYITVTANHLLLTPLGFAKASSLRQGDQVIYYGRFQGPILGDPNDYERPAAIEDVITSLAKSSCMTTGCVPVAAEYLHGDGTFMDGNIDVKSANGFLLSNRASTISEQFRNTSFTWIDTELPGFSGSSDLASVLVALRDATDGGVGSRGESLAFRGRPMRSRDNLRFALSSQRDSRLHKAAMNHRTTDAERFGERQFGFASLVACDDAGNINRNRSVQRNGFLAASERYAKFLHTSFGGVAADTNRLRKALKRFARLVTLLPITRVELLHWDGPVYDIETSQSLYLANGLVSSNCRCAMTEILDTDEEAAMVTGEPKAKAGGAMAMAEV